MRNPIRLLIPSLLLIVSILLPCLSFPPNLKNAYQAKSKNKSQSPHALKAQAEMVEAAKAYRQSLEQLKALQQQDLSTAENQLDRLKASSSTSQQDLSEAERSLSEIRAKLEETKRQIAETDNLIAHPETAPQQTKPLIPKKKFRKVQMKGGKRKPCKGCISV